MMLRSLWHKSPFYFFIPTLLIAFVLLLLLSYTIKLEEQIGRKLFTISTSDLFSITQNCASQVEHLLQAQSNYVEALKNDVTLQHRVESYLKTLLTPNIKYAYLVYKDDRGIFRFLSDASNKEDKAMINQKLDVESPEWFRIYDEKRPVVIHHTLLHQLSLTYLLPIQYDHQVQLVLAIDFSIQKIEEVNYVLAILKRGIIGIMVIIGIILFFLILQAIRLKDIRKNSFIDKLTGVYNRNYLQHYQDLIQLDDYIIAALDIDYFKKINDTYGHDSGDRVLTQIAQTLLASTREKEDIVIRYGGEEFLILAHMHRNDPSSPLNIIEKLFSTIQKTRFILPSNESIQLSVSIGVNLVPQKSRTFQEAFKLADVALYNAKSKGRNTIEIYDESGHKDQRSHLSLAEIKAAIEEDRLTCYYQKIVDVKTGNVSHYEALLRLFDHEKRIITPDKILPSIQGTFLLRNITQKVLSVCYHQLRLHPELFINVNLNPQDIIDETILSLLKTYAQDPWIAKRLGLELVETEDLVRKEKAKENLSMLKHLGYKIFIDDFGSGYSNFIYLAEIKPDFIKIDGSIIQKILTDTISFLLVKNIVTFAKEAGIEVIAEYVSDEGICEQIRDLGIRYAQGFFFSRPEPESSLYR